MKVGDRVTVYKKVREQEETCSHGEKHRVPVYLVKRITIERIEKKLITALHYTHDGIGNVYLARDAQGREYRTQDHWDGPRSTVWVRTDMCAGQAVRQAFTRYPMRCFSRDVFGRALTI